MTKAFPLQQTVSQLPEARYVPEDFHPFLYHDQFAFFQKQSGV